MPLTAKWSRVSPSTSLNRSSHALAVVGNKAYVFGGELVPRTPLNANVEIVDLQTGEVDTISPPSDATDATWPSARVGVAMTSVGSKVYVWGGRGGKAMTPSSSELWAFDTESSKSFTLVPVSESVAGEQPEDRSYHVLTSYGDMLYLHAGCPSKGRLPTLHSLDLSTPNSAWKALPSAPGPGRGGTNLALLPLSTPAFARFGGFAGYELDDFVLFDVEKKEWSMPTFTPESAKPSARSVAGFLGLEQAQLLTSDAESKVVGVLFLGEAESTTPDVGHDGAGFFTSDSFALVSHPSSTFSWVPLPVSSTDAPEGLGWFGSAWWTGGGGAVLLGGLVASNERRGDVWVFRVEKA